jgi:hypothetical protein
VSQLRTSLFQNGAKALGIPVSEMAAFTKIGVDVAYLQRDLIDSRWDGD